MCHRCEIHTQSARVHITIPAEYRNFKFNVYAIDVRSLVNIDRGFFFSFVIASGCLSNRIIHIILDLSVREFNLKKFIWELSVVLWIFGAEKILMIMNFCDFQSIIILVNLMKNVFCLVHLTN